MLNISLTDEAAARLREILNQENEEACIRVREAKIGSACKSRIVLMLSIDERDDDDVEGEAESLPFVISKDLADQYGGSFSVSLDEHRMPVVAALT